jgi:FkbM family methyltransferase
MSVRSHARRWVERTLHAHLIPAEQVALIFQWEHLRSFFKHFQVDCVFDVGGNVGQYATMLRTQVGYRGDIISYEPVPELAAKLRAAAAMDPSWLVEELALDTTEGSASFNVFASDSFSSLHELAALAQQQFRDKVALARRIPVRTATLATELAKYQARLGFTRPFLKMDTQGHDVRVAMGAGSQLRSFVGLQSELAIKRLYEDAPDYEEALEFYRSQGFELSALVPNNLGHFPRLLEIDCIMYRAD